MTTCYKSLVVIFLIATAARSQLLPELPGLPDPFPGGGHPSADSESFSQSPENTAPQVSNPAEGFPLQNHEFPGQEDASDNFGLLGENDERSEPLGSVEKSSGQDSGVDNWEPSVGNYPAYQLPDLNPSSGYPLPDQQVVPPALDFKEGYPAEAPFAYPDTEPPIVLSNPKDLPEATVNDYPFYKDFNSQDGAFSNPDFSEDDSVGLGIDDFDKPIYGNEYSLFDDNGKYDGTDNGQSTGNENGEVNSNPVYENPLLGDDAFSDSDSPKSDRDDLVTPDFADFPGDYRIHPNDIDEPVAVIPNLPLDEDFGDRTFDEIQPISNFLPINSDNDDKDNDEPELKLPSFQPEYYDEIQQVPNFVLTDRDNDPDFDGENSNDPIEIDNDEPADEYSSIVPDDYFEDPFDPTEHILRTDSDDDEYDNNPIDIDDDDFLPINNDNDDTDNDEPEPEFDEIEQVPNFLRTDSDDDEYDNNPIDTDDDEPAADFGDFTPDEFADIRKQLLLQFSDHDDDDNFDDTGDGQSDDGGNGESEDEDNDGGNGESEDEDNDGGNDESEVEDNGDGNGEREVQDNDGGNGESEVEDNDGGNGESEDEDNDGGNGESEVQDNGGGKGNFEKNYQQPQVLLPSVLPNYLPLGYDPRFSTGILPWPVANTFPYISRPVRRRASHANRFPYGVRRPVRKQPPYANRFPYGAPNHVREQSSYANRFPYGAPSPVRKQPLYANRFPYGASSQFRKQRSYSGRLPYGGPSPGRKQRSYANGFPYGAPSPVRKQRSYEDGLPYGPWSPVRKYYDRGVDRFGNRYSFYNAERRGFTPSGVADQRYSSYESYDPRRIFRKRNCC